MIADITYKVNCPFIAMLSANKRAIHLRYIRYRNGRAGPHFSRNRFSTSGGTILDTSP